MPMSMLMAAMLLATKAIVAIASILMHPPISLINAIVMATINPIKRCSLGSPPYYP